MNKILKIVLFALLCIVILILGLVGYNFVVMKIFQDRIDTAGSWSINGKSIVFASHRDGNYEIYTTEIDSKNVFRLTYDSIREDYYPTYSPDGKYIAFVSHLDGQNDIYIMDNSGSNLHAITDSHNIDGAGYCSWSPDGEYLTFSCLESGRYQIHIIKYDGSGKTNISHNNASDRFPQWSPNGKKIVFKSDRNVNNGLYLMNADGSAVLSLTSGYNDNYPDWSPVNNKIVFQRRLGIFNSQIMTIQSSGTNLERITDGDDHEFYPRWSPDATKIIYMSGDLYNSDLFLMDLATKKVKQITEN